MAKPSQPKDIARAGSLLSRLAERRELPRTVRQSCSQSAEALAALRYDAYPAYAKAVNKSGGQTVEETTAEEKGWNLEG